MTSLDQYYQLPFIDLVYDFVRMETEGLDSIYKDYILKLVGVMGFNALYHHGMLEGCGVVNGRQLYVLVNRKEE